MVRRLPNRLPDLKQDLLWEMTLPGAGVGGLVVASDLVIASGRDVTDGSDQFDAFDLMTGSHVWTYKYPAPAALDYGNSPRATPAFASGVLVTLGATGRLSGLDVKTGVALWSVELSEHLGGEELTWGFSGSPLIMNERVYVQVGESASLLVVDLYGGQIVDAFSGSPTVYSSLVPIQIGEEMVVAGTDADGYFVRRITDGSIVWSHQPELSGDFGVPSPVVIPGGLVYVGENNGVQLFHRTSNGFTAKPIAINDSLIPDSHTPVAIGDKLLVAFDGFHCLSIDHELRKEWSVAESLITGYASIIASPSRALVTTEGGELLLFDTRDKGKLIDQTKLSKEKAKLLSHPAIVSDQLLIRVGSELRCYKLAM